MIVAVAVAAFAADSDDPGEVIVVEGDRVHAAREALAARLEEQGYGKSRNKGDYILFVPNDAWKWRVRIHDDGWVDYKQSPPRLHAPGKDFASDGGGGLWALRLIRPDECIAFGSAAQSITDARVVTLQQDHVADAIAPEVHELQDALVDQAMQRRLYVELPRECAAIWADPGLTVAQRKAALLELWDSRSDTDAGDQARDAIAAFLRAEVQTSPDPITPGELAAFNAQRRAARELVLSSG